MFFRTLLLTVLIHNHTGLLINIHTHSNTIDTNDVNLNKYDGIHDDTAMNQDIGINTLTCDNMCARSIDARTSMDTVMSVDILPYENMHTYACAPAHAQHICIHTYVYISMYVYFHYERQVDGWFGRQTDRPIDRCIYDMLDWSMFTTSPKPLTNPTTESEPRPIAEGPRSQRPHLTTTKSGRDPSAAHRKSDVEHSNAPGESTEMLSLDNAHPMAYHN